MTQTELALLVSIVAGFVLLAATVGAFMIGRPRLGVAVLVLAAVAFIGSLVLMGRVSGEWQTAKRQEVLAKYDVRVQEWGAPLGSSPEWKVDGKVADCIVVLSGDHAPFMTCNDKEMPKR